MTDLYADEKGVLRGSFLVPSDMPAGTHAVEATGSLNKTAQTSFTGQGIVRTQTVQSIITRTLVTYQRYDPLAQTFTFDRDTYLAGVDFYVKNKGLTSLTLDIRTCENGIPTQEILRRVRIEPWEVVNIDNNQPTLATFEPLRLQEGLEYCFVLMADDAAWAVEVAELGKRDVYTDKWVTAQAFQIGVLLSSSNASTWTPHQKKDMRFRLHEAVFTTTARNYQLGTFDLYDADIVHADYIADRVDEETDATLIMTMPDGKTEYRLKEDTIVSFSEKVTGKASIKMELKGTASKTPVAMDGIAMVSASTIATGEYVTKHITLGDDVDVRVSFEAATGPRSSVVAYYSTNSEWKELPLAEVLQLDNEFNARTYKLDGITGDTIRVRLVLKGDAKDRPRVRKLRVVTI